METRTSGKAEQQFGLCPECGARHVFRNRLLVGELLTCDQCRCELEVAGLRPLVLQHLAKVEKDEDDFMR